IDFPASCGVKTPGCRHVVATRPKTYPWKSGVLRPSGATDWSCTHQPTIARNPGHFIMPPQPFPCVVAFNGSYDLLGLGVSEVETAGGVVTPAAASAWPSSVRRFLRNCSNWAFAASRSAVRAES